MTLTLRDEVEQIINQRGKMTRTALYCQFELVAKRALDSALEDLARTHRIVLGATEVAPVRAAKRMAEKFVFGDSATDAYGQALLKAEQLAAEERQRQARLEPTLPERICTALRHGSMTVRELHQAVEAAGSPVKEVDIRKALSRMKGRSVDNPSWGRWALAESPINQPGTSLPRRVLALFAPGVRLSREQIRAELSDANDGSVSAALSDLVTSGKLRNQRCKGYWLPVEEEEGAAA